MPTTTSQVSYFVFFRDAGSCNFVVMTFKAG